MSQDLIITIIRFLPTVIVALVLLIAIIKGIRRGFRKSLILFIHYGLALGIGIAIFFVITKNIYTMDLHGAYELIGNQIGVNTNGAKTLFDFIEALVQTKAPEYVNMVTYPEFQQTVYAIGGIGVNLVFGIICLIVIPFLLRTIFYLFYLLFYSQRKHKRHITDRGDRYKKHWFGGLLIGTAKGVIESLIWVSLISTIYYIAAGGIYRTEAMKEEDRIEALDALGLQEKGYDANKLYDAIKTSRKYGLTGILDKVKIGGNPVDYLFMDLMLTSKFDTLKLDEKGNKIYAEINLRKEVATIVGAAQSVLESNAIKIEKIADQKFNIIVDQEKLDEQLVNNLSETIKGSVLLNELVPLNLKATAKGIKNGDIKVDASIKEYFTDEYIQKIDEIDFSKEYGEIFKVLFGAVELLPVNNDGQFDFDLFKDQTRLIDYALNLDTQKVKNLFTELSNVKLVSEIAAPIGVSLFVSNVKQQGGTGAEIVTDLDLSKVNFKEEIANLGNIYENFKNLELDTEILLSKDQTMIENYIYDLAEDKDNTFKPAANHFIDSIIGVENAEGEIEGSYLLGQVALLALKKEAAKFEVTIGQGPEAEKKNLKDILGDNLTNYTTAYLKDDLHLLVDSCLPALPIVRVIKDGKDNNIIKTLKDVDVEKLEYALVGNSNPNIKSGIFDLHLLGNNKADEVIETFILGYAKQIAGENATPEEVENLKNQIRKVESWENEFRQVCAAAVTIQGIDGLENITFDDKFLETFPVLEAQAVDDLSKAVSQTTLISNILITKLKETMEDLAKVEIDWDKNEIDWLDKLDNEGNIKERGEINVLLNSLNVLTEKDAQGNLIINLDDPFPFVKGLVDTNLPDSKEKYAKSDKLGNSKAVGLLLEVIIDRELNKEENQGFPFELPENIVWSNTYNADGTLKKRGELAALIEILNLPILQDENGNMTTEKLQDLDALAQLTTKEVEDIAKSTILMSNIKGLLKDVTKDSEFKIIVPNNLTPENFAYSLDTEGKEDYANGEFGKVMHILKQVREQVITDPAKPKLTTDDLLLGVINLDDQGHQNIVDSVVLYETISNVIIETAEKPDSVIKIREEAYVQKPTLMVEQTGETQPETQPEEPTKWIKKSEITQLLKAARGLKIKDFNNVDVDTIVSEFVLDNSELMDDVVDSNILNITIVDNIIKNNQPAQGQTEKPLAITAELENINSTKWYGATGELHNILYGLAAMNVEGSGLKFENGSVTIVENDLIKGLNQKVNPTKEETRLDYVYASDIIARTITQNVDNIEQIKTRNIAYVDANEPMRKLQKQELSTLVTIVVDDLGVTDITNIQAADIINKLTVENEELINNIVSSNILSKTAIYNIIENNKPTAGEEAPLVISDTLSTEKDGDYVNAWYGLDGELKHILNGLAAINGKEKGLEYTGTEILVYANELIKGLNEPASTTNPELGTRLELVYKSDIVSKTITKNIDNDQSGAVKVRREAYVDYNAQDGRVIKLDEMSKLVEVANAINLDIDNVVPSDIINKLDINDENGAINGIVQSNILNKTIISNIVNQASENLIISTELTTVDPQTDDYSANWYGQTGELKQILNGLAALNTENSGFQYTKNGVVIDETLLIKGLNSEVTTDRTRLNYVYASDIISRTITDKVNKISALDVRETAYMEDAKEPTAKLQEVELKKLVDIVNSLGISDVNKIDGEVLINSLDLTKEETIKTVATSNILNKTIITNVINANKVDGSLQIPENLANQTANDYANEWYSTETEKGELENMLSGLAAINNNGFAYQKGQITVNADALVLGLNEPAVQGGVESRLNYVYRSEIIARTITKNVKDVKALTPRAQAFTDETHEMIKEEEFKTLVTILNDDLQIQKLEEATAELIINKLDVNERGLIQSIVKSNILNATVVDNIIKANTGNQLEIPTTLDSVLKNEWYNTYNELGEVKTTGELEHMLLGLAAVRNHGFTYINGEMNVNADNLVLQLNGEASNGMTRLNYVYASEVIARTITAKVSEVEALSIRNEAYVDSITKAQLKEVEIEKLVGILNIPELKITSLSAIKPKTLIDNLSVTNQTLIQGIVRSNILNKTIVHNVMEANNKTSQLIIEGDLLSEDHSSWYGDMGELAKMLLGIAAINGHGFTYEDSGITVNADSLVLGLNETATVGQTRLDYIYNSDIISRTVTDKITKVENVKVRPSAMKDNKIDKAEISGLVTILTDDLHAKTLSDINLTNLVASLQGEPGKETIKHIVNSNILNMTIISMIQGNNGNTLVINSNLQEFTTDYNNTWYGQTGELSSLLLGMNALGIQAQGGQLAVDTKGLINNLAEEAQTIYNSQIFAATFSKEVISTNTVPELDINGNALIQNVFDTKVLVETEFKALMNALKVSPVKIGSGFDATSLANVALDNQTLTTILNSAIMHKMFSDSISATGFVTLTYYKNDTDQKNIVTTLANGERYIAKDEITKLITGLNELQLTNIDNLKSINEETLKAVANNSQLVTIVSDSAILSNIFSKVIIPINVNIPIVGQVSLLEAIERLAGVKSQILKVMAISGNTTVSVDTLSEANIKAVLTAYNSVMAQINR